MSKLKYYHAFVNEAGEVQVTEHEYVSEDMGTISVIPGVQFNGIRTNYFYKQDFLLCGSHGAITCDREASLQLLQEYHEDIIKRAMIKIGASNVVLGKIKKLHQNECPHENIEYDSTYEMRSRNMYCEDCGKSGSREELQPDKAAIDTIHIKVQGHKVEEAKDEI